MHQKFYSCNINAPVSEVWKFHSSAEALQILTPPNRKIQLLSQDTRVVPGAIHKIRVTQFGIPLEWHAKIVDVKELVQFVDEALRSPFAYWRHEHRFEALRESTQMTDIISYRLPLGILGRIANSLFVSGNLDSLFAFRHAATKKALELKAPGRE